MAKQKSLTPQEIYKARKHREEQEKDALLPPGLVNNGNTCFMNSVLQGLISTRPLFDLIVSAPQSSTTAIPPIALQRSPQLTNGHGLGREHEQAWVEGMPLGDVFVHVMYSAWNLQQQRRRESISPRELLTALGSKYDQYLDFAQQDAHEFLRQLLDAMRMEELDIIKKRQPSRFQERRRRKPLPLSSLSPDPPTSPPISARDATPSPRLPNPTTLEEHKLSSFVDMLFGGELTSILVCEKCKHVSQSYEDFNDLSLSIKPEDYARERRRHRLKMFAKKLTSFPGAALGVGMESASMQRSSSVPPTENSFRGVDDIPVADEPRRRSLDFAAELDAGRGNSIEHDDVNGSPVASGGPPSPPDVVTDGRDGDVEVQNVAFAEEPRKSKEKGEKVKDDDKKKDDDGWAKFGRRISMRVGLGKAHKDQKERKSRGRQILKEDIVAEVPRVKESDENIVSQNFSTARTSTSDVGDKESTEVRGQLETGSLPTAHPTARPAQGGAPTLVPSLVATRANLPSTSRTSLSRFPHIQRPTSKRPRSPRPPNPTPQETAYLRQILADITPASPNPFAFLKPSTNGASPLSAATTQSLWLKMGQLPGIEECLKMFTAVEILDGDNMVGCRRCWKIANGVYNSRPPDGEEQGSDSDENEKPDINEVDIDKPSPLIRQSSAPSSPTSSVAMSLSSPTLSLFTHRNLSDGVSISTLPTTLSSESPLAYKNQLPQPLVLNDDPVSPESSPEGEWNTYVGSPAPQRYSTPPESPNLTARPDIPRKSLAKPEESSPAHLTMYAGFSIPVISTTAPESPMSTPVTARPSANVDMMNHLTPSAPRNHLFTHPLSRRRRPKETDVDSTDESSGTESDASASTYSYDHSEASTVSLTVTEDQPPPQQRRRPSPRSKQVIMRPAYKRYLIATPPPILVIHLKRFQQLSKTPMISFSNGFKKLDDFVTFPEYLDLTPFLAPKKEDFGLDKGEAKKRSKVRPNGEERCMYRLYAVVVHIGNMLGGHYVAYTALPGVPAANATSAGSENPSTTAKTTVKPTRQWAYISDTVVRLVTLDEVLKVKAYMCMYERV